MGGGGGGRFALVRNSNANVGMENFPLVVKVNLVHNPRILSGNPDWQNTRCSRYVS